MADEPSILSKEQETKLSKYFDNLVAHAESAPPELKDFKDAKSFIAAKNAYYNNPLAAQIEGFRKERDELIANGQDAKAADAVYQTHLEDAKNKFLRGAQHGAPDPNAEQKQQGIFDSLLSGDFMGAIKKMLMAIPFIGDLMAAGAKWLKSKFSGGESIDFATARERITLEKALDGASANLGMDGNAAAVFRANGIEACEHPEKMVEVAERKPEKLPAHVKDPAKSAAPKNTDPVFSPEFEAPNGSFPQPPVETPARNQALAAAANASKGQTP